MTNVPNWPLTVTSVAFAGDPFDAGSTLVYTDISTRVDTFNTSIGKQYELDQVQAGEAAYTLYDSDESLNPTNPSSPYYPNVKVFRRTADQSMYPAAPVGAAVNLLNATAGFDPSFESSTVGATPSWITAVGGTTPVIGTTTPNSGVNDLTYTTAATSTAQGVSWKAATLPGQTYTASTYVRQSTASTQQISVGGLGVTDRFQRTGALSGSTTDNGGFTWIVNGGVSGDYTTTSSSSGLGVASITSSTVNVDRFATVSPSAQDSDQRVLVTLPAVATGALYTVTLVSRFTDANNQYRFGINCNTNGTVDVGAWRKVAGVWAQLSLNTGVFTYSAGTQVWLRFQTTGNTLQGKAWLTTAIEPSSWISNTDTSLPAGPATGFHVQLSTGNTMVSPVVTYAQYAATYGSAGTITTTTGSYVRLTSTFVATQPLHTIQIATTGTATAGTVLIDDIQLEPGGTASAFSSTGPVIYGNFAGYVERWPSNWNYQGTYGIAQITCVDAFAPLANTLLHTAYTQSVLAKKPAYYWRLNDGASVTTFAESSGNNGPGLVRVNASTGGSPTFAPNTAIAIAGDPGAVGVHITGGTISQATAMEAYTLSIGTNTGTMGFTAALWFLADTAPTITGVSVYLYGTFEGTDFLLIAPNTTSMVIDASLSSGAFGVNHGTGLNLKDGKVHLLIATVQVASNSITTQTWVDGVLAQNNTDNVTTAFGSAAPDFRWNNIEVGGQADAYNGGGSGMQGIYAHVALWNRALSSTEIADLVNGGKGYPGETSGQRIARYLTSSYIGPTAIDTGSSTMAVDSLAERTAALDGCQAVALSENGNFFQSRSGFLTFQGRSLRYLELTPVWVFGETTGSGEIPYLPDIAFDFDPTQIFNDVTVTRTDGAVVESTDNASQLSYGVRSYQRTINIASDLETIDAANWILGGHKQPTQRLQALTIDPGANPAVWPCALGARIGDRATVKRRTAAGYTMSADYFIERIETNRAPGQWKVTFQMSPASLGEQPWILGDSVYGVLGVTTNPGY